MQRSIQKRPLYIHFRIDRIHSFHNRQNRFCSDRTDSVRNRQNVYSQERLLYMYILSVFPMSILKGGRVYSGKSPLYILKRALYILKRVLYTLPIFFLSILNGGLCVLRRALYTLEGLLNTQLQYTATHCNTLQHTTFHKR